MKPALVLYTVSALVAVAALPLPYSYYMGVRFLACFAFSYVAYESFRAKAWRTAALSIAGAIVFNPLVPIHASKSVWAAVDLSAAAYLAVIASHVSSNFKAFRPPEVSVGQVAVMVAAAVFAAVFCMTLLAFVLFVVTLPADLLGYREPTRTLSYLYPPVGIAAALAFLAGWVYRSGASGEPMRPNPSLKRSANGKPPGPRGAVVYPAPRGPGVLPSSPA